MNHSRNCRNPKPVLRSALSLIALVLIASVGLLISCGEQYNSPNEPQQAQEPVVLSKENPQVKSVISVQKRYQDFLFTHPEVVGVGTGLSEDGKLAIVVYTASEVKRAPLDVKSLAKTTTLEAVPEIIEDLPVVTKVTGRFRIYVDPTTRFPRPVPTGVSTGHPDITAGTIGCRVKDSQGNVYALSNNHVYADQNDAQIGDAVIQPGSFDGGSLPDDFLSNLHDFEPLDFSGGDNIMDAAIAFSTTDSLGFSTPSDGYGTPSPTTVLAFVGQSVQKYGRTTGLTQGQVSEINVTVNVCYETRGPFRCVKLAKFIDQIAITPGDFSEGGDSGSLIITDDNNKNPVGLLFAGSSTRTIANPIDAVLSRFNVTIDDGGGTTNNPPTADFTFTTSGLTADFTDQSTDSDGSVVAWDWDFGDVNTSTAQHPSHTYAASGTYTVSLTVTDNGGATSSTSQDVTVSDGSGGGITLSATGYKVKGLQKADLTWGGATGAQVEIHREGVLIATTDNDGFYTDNIDQRGGGSYTYQVCESGGSPCSNTATVNF